MKKILYDIEIFPNYACWGFKDYITKEITFFEISEEKNQIKEIYEYLTNFKGFLIGFNSIHYDNMISKYLILNYDKYKSYYYGDICFDLKWFSDKVINDDFDDLVKDIKYQKMNWTDIDLFLYWSKGLRISKQISLKGLGIQLGYPVVQELPFKPDTILKKEDLPILRTYNSIHDLGILELLLDRMNEDVMLRDYVRKEYGLECWSMDAPKIASEYLLEYYCQWAYPQARRNKPYWEFKKEVRNLRYEPKPWKIGDYLPEVKFKTQFFDNIYKEFYNSYNDNIGIKKILFNQKSSHPLMLSISAGGIHTVNNNEKWKEDELHYIIDADIAGLYPTLFRNYKFLRKDLQIILEKYVQMIDDRTEAKRSGDKKKDAFLKLCNNSFSGLVDSNVTWLYSPEHILALRITGQLIQLRFIEELNEIGITTIFSNTDGTLAKVPKSLSEEYHEIAKKISKEFNVEWEFCLLKSIHFQNTNFYISNIYEEYMLDNNLNKINVNTNGKIKRKGKTFRYDKDVPLGDSVDEQVIAKALEAYLIHGIDIEEFISNPDKYNLHIYDYCKSNKISKQYVVYWNNEIQQQLNRYYFSKDGTYLYKKKYNNTTLEHVNVGEPVLLYNIHEEKSFEDYNINYNYYINKVKTIVSNLHNNYQLKLF